MYRKFLYSIFLTAWFLAAISCNGQKMVSQVSESKKLEINRKQFIGKPLSKLLAQISPEIKGAVGSPGDGFERASYIIFYFQNTRDHRESRSKKIAVTSIRVYFKESFEWERTGRTMENWMDWTEEDARKYGHLIVGEIKVSN